MSNWLDHSSIVGHIGKYGQKISDPLSWVTNGKWAHLTSDVLPEKVNGGLSTVMKPFEKVDKTINPVRKIPIVNRVGDIVANKPGDALALAAGAYFGGSALMAGGGTGGAAGGGTASVGEGGLGTASGFGGVGMDGGVAGIGEGGLGSGAVGTGAGTADVGGLASLDSAAVDSEGAAPGLTESYGSAESSGGSASSLQRQQQIGKLMQQMAQQQEQRAREAEQSRVNVDAPTLQNPYATSSKAKKTAPTGNVQQALARGAAGADPIDTNGVQAAAIQEVSKRLEAAKARLAELQKESR